MRTLIYAVAASSALTLPTSVRAEIPEPVRAMIDAAIATSDAAKVSTVIELAKATNPDDAAELDAILSAFQTDLAAKTEAEAAAEEKAVRNAGLFDNWSGKGQLGASRSSGNSSNTGVTAGLSLVRDGQRWRHKLAGRVDYQESNGATTREQFFASYEPNWKVNDSLYLYALGQFERDRFQGFSARYSASGGLGYDVIVSDDMNLSVKAGPAWRRTELTNGTSTGNLAGLAALDFDWQIAEGIVLTENASAIMQDGSSTIVSDTGIQASVSSDIKVGFFYTVEHDTNPPLGAVQTDTLSRITLIYDF